MRILLVIHGYPPRYNAGSEVYTQLLARGLAPRHEVRVFTRQEDPFLARYSTHEETDSSDSRISLRVINNPENRDRYRHDGVDAKVEALLHEFDPDVVHVNHVSHLSTSLIQSIKRRGVPIVFTLHDFWLMCPRGQFLMRNHESGGEPFVHCSGQEDRKCAQHCYSHYFSGDTSKQDSDIAAWTSWVAQRMAHVREMAGLVDRFIAPSMHLLARFRDEFGLPEDKLHYIDYGFDHRALTGRRRAVESDFVFGYIGTHIPAKGIHHLLQSFGAVKGNARLRIWGRTRDPYTSSLKRLASQLPGNAASRIEWMGEYRNEDIVASVFDKIDAIVVPSIWEENSPLVIHEAQQVRVPVITADVGGMSEYVHHAVNGLLFRHRDRDDLTSKMQDLASDPGLAIKLGARGYLLSAAGDVPAIDDHVKQVEAIYQGIAHNRCNGSVRDNAGPWRITFDTNPDDCNLSCVMCEEHSEHSPLRQDRLRTKRPPRRMDISLVRKVLESCKGTRLREVIPSTMGEPLLYDQFDEFISLCTEFGVRMNLTTNGTFPRKGAKEWAELLVPVCSDVKISVNGATPDTQAKIMVGSKLERVHANVLKFIQVRDRHVSRGADRCTVTFQVTFLEENVRELPALIRQAAAMGVDRVKGHHLWAHFVQIESLSMRRSRESIEIWNDIVAECEQVAERNLLPNGNRVRLENIHRLDPSSPEDLAKGGTCPFLGEEAWISTEGRFNPCCAPDAQRRTLGDFGTVTDQPLMRIWQGAPYLELQRTYRDHELCRSCNMRRPLGSP